MDWWKNTLVLSSKRKIVLEWLELEIVLEQTLLSFLLLSLKLLIDAAQKNSLWWEILMLMLSTPQPLKHLSKHFPLA